MLVLPDSDVLCVSVRRLSVGRWWTTLMYQTECRNIKIEITRHTVPGVDTPGRPANTTMTNSQ